jgi:hypothetical protein
MEKLFTGWGFRVSEFCFFFSFSFCHVWLQQESILFGLLKVSQARLELAVSGLVGGWGGGLVGQQALDLQTCKKIIFHKNYIENKATVWLLVKINKIII